MKMPDFSKVTSKLSAVKMPEIKLKAPKTAKSGALTPKKILAGALAAVLVAGGIAGGLIVAKNSRPVSVYSVGELMIDYSWSANTQTGGSVTTDDIQSVYISSTQQIKEICVKEGQEVKKGDTLLIFDTTLSELQLTRKKLDVQKLTMDLAKAKKEREAMNHYGVSGGGTSTEEEDLDPVPYLPYLRGGEGTKDEPLIFVWSDDSTYSMDFINTFLDKMPDTPDVPDTPDTPSEDTSGGDAPAEEAAPADTSAADAAVSETAAEETPAEDTGSGDSSGGEAEPSDEGEITPEPAPTIPIVYAVFEVRTGDSLDGDVERVWEICFRRSTDNSVTATLFSPSSDYDKSNTEEESTGYMGATYTYSELQKMKMEADKEIREMELKLKTTQLEADKMEYELNNGEVVAKIDGVIKTLRTADEALADDAPLLLLSGGGGYKITGLLGETDLNNTSIGDTVTVNSWSSGCSYTGTISAISEYPVEASSLGSYYYSSGNNNVSTYPVTVFVDEDASLKEGETVDITFSKSRESSSFYVMAPFVRSEKGSSYVYVRGENGRLEKRTVKTGSNLYGSYVEILSGITTDDWLAFPYGSKVSEGRRTVESDTTELNSSYTGGLG